MDSLENEMHVEILQQAAKLIESDGSDGLHSAARLVGMPTALALLITHLRRGYGSMSGGWPADPEIDTKVVHDLLAEEPLVMNFFSQPCALFYTGEWYCFDNFSAFTVEWRSKLWPTVEHAYQAAKFHDEEIAERIRHASLPHLAKKMGNDPTIQDKIRPDWQEVKEPIMEEILRAKLAQHEYVQKKLRKSRGILLVEDSPQDVYWGRGENWNGQNRLGRTWARLRDEFYP